MMVKKIYKDGKYTGKEILSEEEHRKRQRGKVHNNDRLITDTCVICNKKWKYLSGYRVHIDQIEGGKLQTSHSNMKIALLSYHMMFGEGSPGLTKEDGVCYVIEWGWLSLQKAGNLKCVCENCIPKYRDGLSKDKSKEDEFDKAFENLPEPIKFIIGILVLAFIIWMVL